MKTNRHTIVGWIQRMVMIGKSTIAVGVLSMSLFSSMTYPRKQHLPGIVDITADTIKVLAIGNSFSQDALEFYLSGLARAAGIPIVIGNLSIGGASLALHWDNASSDKAVYVYKKINAEGKRESWSNTTISEALSDQDWDFVSFQQVSQNAGRFETFIEPLPLLYSYVQEKLQGKETKFVFHQTWAYAQNATHGGFKQYNRNQLEMYHAIVEVSKRVKDLVPINIVVPSGTAIQNGRTSVIGDNFCRDGFHLDVNIGSYTAAATWFEVISGKSVIGNTFKPEALSTHEVEIAQQAAHAAMLNPYKISELVHYKK